MRGFFRALIEFRPMALGILAIEPSVDF